jgi:glutamine amidotransferase
MCRFIVAAGTFDANAIVAAAVAMSSGETADHDSSIRVHHDGWGAVWRDPGSATGLSVFHDTRPATETASGSRVAGIRTDFLAIHVRHATGSTTRGLPFTHPLRRSADDWVFMHNGTQPTIHRLLGLDRSTFDSAEYFDYLISPGATTLDRREILDRLRGIPLGGTSANAVAVRPDCAYVICYSSDRTASPRYFTMYQLVEPGRHIVASDVIPALAPADRWQPVPPETILEFILGSTLLPASQR